MKKVLAFLIAGAMASGVAAYITAAQIEPEKISSQRLTRQ